MDATEIEWIAVAWPVAYGNSGDRAFLATSGGEVFQCANRETRYEGSTAVPFDPYHLLPRDWKPGDALPAAGYTAWFGTEWKPTN